MRFVWHTEPLAIRHATAETLNWATKELHCMLAQIIECFMLRASCQMVGGRANSDASGILRTSWKDLKGNIMEGLRNF